MKLRSRLAICIAKITDRIIRKWNRGSGGVFPGYIARLIDPEILFRLSVQVRKKTIVVLGTNGKTTVSNLLCHVLERAGNTVVLNRNGANMLNGIVSAFVLAADGKGYLDADYACIEVDEFASEEVLRRLRPHCVVVTNLFRDQLDRFGEVDLVLERIGKAVSLVPDAVLLLNSDDPISYSLVSRCKNPVVSYGISEGIPNMLLSDSGRESTFCRVCGNPVEYKLFHYGQLGIWHCPACKTARPKPDYSASEIGFGKEGYYFRLETALSGEKAVGVNRGIRFPYNIYNTLAAYGALTAMNAQGCFEVAVKSFDYGNNREGVFAINGGKVQLHLAKNPLGFQQKLLLLLRDPLPKDVIIQINDTEVDGRDVSWLWDVDFQCLEDAGTGEIFVDGTRRYDMGLRLKYEGIRWELADDMRKTVENLLLKGTGNLYVIVNYSGLYRMNELLGKLEKNPQKQTGGCKFEADHRAYVSQFVKFVR